MVLNYNCDTYIARKKYIVSRKSAAIINSENVLYDAQNAQTDVVLKDISFYLLASLHYLMC